ncbi:MAG: replication protein [Halanaeroarchaeum sp.]
MSGGRRNVTSESAIGSAGIGDLPEDRSRPSKTNCTTRDTAAETTKSGSSESDFEEWWRRKNAIVDRFVEERPRRAVRPISVRGGTKLRDEAARQKHGSDEERFRSQPWSAVLDEFLSWYNEYRDAELVFGSPEGDQVRAEMENSHMPQYGNRYYARIKAFERQIVREYDDPHSVMLTFSGSSANETGGWRCPADHLRDVIESWRPKRGRGVYHALRDVLDGKRWEYVIVVEKHQSGYGHVHCGVFVDGHIEEGDFHGVIDTHLRVCEIAGRDAHDYHSPDPDDRPISVNRIDPGNAEEGAIGNLGSYIGEYIGAYGDELFDRGLDELIFRAAAWATGTQLVRFSTGANELIEQDLATRRDDDPPEERVVPNPEFDPDVHATPESDIYPGEIENPGWSIVGIARGDDLYELRESHVTWREIDDASHLDPPKAVPPDRPRRRTDSSTLASYQ